jgi:tRNA (guanine37-N1)-methyltransferase
MKRAIEKGLVEVHFHNLRDYTTNKQRSVDDYQFGGGAGMILRPDVIESALNANFDINHFRSNTLNKMIITSPRGAKFTQNIAHNFSTFNEIIILCNRYEGVDQRAIEFFQFQEIQ